MKNYRKLAQQTCDAADLIRSTAEKEGRELTEDELAQIDAHLADTDRYLEMAKREEKIQSVQSDLQSTIREPITQRITTPDPTAGPAQARDRVEEGKHGFPTLGHMTAAVMTAGLPGGTIDNRLLIGAGGTGLQQGVGSRGGFLVPPTFAETIWDGLAADNNSLLQYCTVFDVVGESLTFPAVDESSRANGSRWGGTRGFWIDEVPASGITASYPKFRQVKLEPQELAVATYISDKLLRNASGLEQFVRMAMTEELSFKIGDAIINGSGAGQPKGVMNAEAKVDITKETGQDAATIMAENLMKAYARLHPRCRANAKWFYNIACEVQLQQMVIGLGLGAAPVFMPPGGISGRPYSTIYGLECVPIEYAQALGTSGDIILADLSMYAVGRGYGPESAVSPHIRFLYNESVMKVTMAIDGQPLVTSSGGITPFKGTDTLSPFLTIATRS